MILTFRVRLHNHPRSMLHFNQNPKLLLVYRTALVHSHKMWKLANHCVKSRAVRHSHFRCEPLSGFYHHTLKLISFLRRQTQQLYQKSLAYEKHARRVHWHRYFDAQAAERQCLYKEIRGGGVKHKDCQTGASDSCHDWCVNSFCFVFTIFRVVKTPSCTMITLRAEITCTWCVECGVIMCVAAPMAKKTPPGEYSLTLGIFYSCSFDPSKSNAL